MTRSDTRVLLRLILSAFGVWVSAQPAEANPGFARKYGVSCAMCHVAFPKLNDFGRAFASNGYQFPGEDPAQRSIQTGDSRLHLPTDPRFAIRADGFFRVRNDGPAKTDFESPLILKLFSTGNLAKDVTYYFYFLAAEGGEVVGPEDAFLYLNNIVGERDLDLMIGQFQVMDTFYPREQRLTFQDLAIYTTDVEAAAGGGGSFTLTYDRGVLAMGSAGPLFAMLGLTNGNGLSRATDGRFDNNGYKNQLARVAVTRPGFSLGVFGYHGKNSSAITGQANRFWRYGPDLAVVISPRVDVRANWLVGRDEHPSFTPGEAPVDHYGGLVETDVHFNDRWTSVLLYNQVSTKDLPVIETRTVTGNLTYYRLRNLKFFIEYTHDLLGRSIFHPVKTHSGVLGMVLAY